MQINCKNIIVAKNKDGTYKLELPNCFFKDENGKDIKGMVIFPRVTKSGMNLFKNENILLSSEIFKLVILE